MAETHALAPTPTTPLAGPEVADFLRTHRFPILDRWLNSLRATTSESEGSPGRETAERLLDALIARFGGETDPLARETRDGAAEAAFRQGLTAADLVRSHIALKQSLLEALSAESAGDARSLAGTREVVEAGVDEETVSVCGLCYRAQERALRRELRESEARFGTLVQTMNEGVCMVDREARITFFNKRLEGISGYTLDEARNQPLSLLYDEEALSRVRSELERRRSGEPSVYETEMVTRSGAKVPVSISGVPLWDDAGNYEGSFGVITDISRRREAQQELQRRSGEIGRLLEVERKRAAQLTMVSEIARLVLSTLDPEEIMRLSVASIQRNFDFYDVFLFSVDNEARDLVLRTHAGAYLSFVSEGYRQPLGVGIIGWVGQTGEVLLANDVTRESRRILAFPQEEKTQSELCVPIRLGEQVIGVIDVQSERLNAFDEHDATSLLVLANLIANAVENARIFQGMKFLKEFSERVIDSIPMPLLFIDRNLTIISVNRAYCDRMERGRGDLEGKSLREVVPDSLLLQDEVLVSILVSIREARPVKLQNVLRPREFLNKVFNVLITPVERGQERQALVVLEDITEAVERSYQFSMLRQVSETMQGILDLDRLLYALLTCVTAGTALGFNRALLLLVDWQREVIQGKMGVGPASVEEASQIWRDLAAQNPTLDDILKHYDEIPDLENTPMSRLAKRITIPLSDSGNVVSRSVQEGKAIRVTDAYHSAEVPADLREILGSGELVCVPLMAKDRAVGAVIADNLYSGRPISDESVHLLNAFSSQAGRAIENAGIYAQIEEKVQELEDANQRIKQAQGELVRSERLAVVGELSARMAHEIRNPLSTIGGFARSIARGTRPDRAQTNAGIIVEEVERLEKLLADTLRFTRSTPMDLRMTDLNALVETVLGLLRDGIDESAVSVERSLEPDLPGIVADAAQIKQLLLNLYQNALQAMPQGGRLHVLTARGAGSVEMRVEDTGVGIPKEDLHQVFSPFFTTKTYGTGLGLAISRKIVSDHAGDISISSSPGVGTAVTVRLPIRMSET